MKIVLTSYNEKKIYYIQVYFSELINTVLERPEAFSEYAIAKAAGDKLLGVASNKKKVREGNYLGQRPEETSDETINRILGRVKTSPIEPDDDGCGLKVHLSNPKIDVSGIVKDEGQRNEIFEKLEELSKRKWSVSNAFFVLEEIQKN